MRRAIGLAFALVLVTATPAVAHVTVNPGEVAEGSFAKLTFRVPNESDTASTVKVEVAFPEGLFEGAGVKPTPGWTHAVTMDGAAVGSITWEGGEIGIDEFQEFDISVGPIPEVETIEFRAVQTYSDGEVVRWIDPVDGDEEPEYPAPTLTVVEGTGGHDGGAAADDGTDPAAFAALLIAGAATVAAVAALIFARKRPPA